MSKRGLFNCSTRYYREIEKTGLEWRKNRVTRATFAVVAWATMKESNNEIAKEDREILDNVLATAVQLDTIYVAYMEKTIGVLYLGDSLSALAKYEPQTSIGTWEIMEIKTDGEERANEILNSMVNKGTISSYHHIEAEELLVMTELISNPVEEKTECAPQKEVIAPSPQRIYCDDRDDYESLHDRPSYFDYDHYYREDDYEYDYYAEQRERWAEEHMNPWGTEDCGDGYIDSDGVFYEY